MPSVVFPDRLPYGAVVAFLGACGFRPEQVKQARILPLRVELEVVDDGGMRPLGGDGTVFHTVRIPFEPEGVGLQDAQPQDAA